MEGSMDDDATYDREVASRDLDNLLKTHENIGYKKGIEEGQEDTPSIQAGFDTGFLASKQIGLDIGKARAREAMGLCEERSGVDHAKIFTDEVIEGMIESVGVGEEELREKVMKLLAKEVRVLLDVKIYTHTKWLLAPCLLHRV
jgi:hypothetical protein